ncbi:hypothetical protein MK280_11400, partial [Myxococcota bacterium]|nr:hypothetical protein [Myxococcota bacterium]
ARFVLAVILFAWTSNYIYAAATDTGFESVGFYLNCAISSLLIAALTTLPEFTGAWNRLDRWLGDLSYPVYLMHMQTGAFTAALCALMGWSPSLFLATAPSLMIVSWLMASSVDRPIERFRNRVKKALREDRSPQ